VDLCGEQVKKTMNTPSLAPFCHSTEVELLSFFGSQLSTEQLYC
jgi:hypothetical protein